MKAERQVCKLPLTLMPKEVGNAFHACHSDTTDCKVRPAIFQACVGARAGIDSGSAARARQTHGDRRITRDGAEPRGAFSELSSGLEPGAVVSLAVARVLLEMVVRIFVSQGPVVIGVDDTLERRRGEKIEAKGIHRDPVRSSHSHVVKASELRWLCAMRQIYLQQPFSDSFSAQRSRKFWRGK